MSISSGMPIRVVLGAWEVDLSTYELTRSGRLVATLIDAEIELLLAIAKAEEGRNTGFEMKVYAAQIKGAPGTVANTLRTLRRKFGETGTTAVVFRRAKGGRIRIGPGYPCRIVRTRDAGGQDPGPRRHPHIDDPDPLASMLRRVAGIPNPEIRDAARRVLLAPEFPRMMAVSSIDVLVPNPVWVAEKSNAPMPLLTGMLHGETHLVSRRVPGAHPQILCYWSVGWKAFLLPFMNKARPKPVFEDTISTPAPPTITNTGEFVVSVKRHQEFPNEMWLYIFEFLDVVYPDDAVLHSEEKYAWLEMDRLTERTAREANINSDVVRALRTFGVPLRGLTPSRFGHRETGSGSPIASYCEPQEVTKKKS